MAEIATPSTVEAFAESALKELLEAQVTYIPAADIYTGHTRDTSADTEDPCITVTVTREEEYPDDTGWWTSTVECELDPRGWPDADIEAAWLQIETALGDGDNDIESQIEATAAAASRLKVMSGSVRYDQAHDYDPGDGERLRYFRFSGSFGILAPA